MRYIGYFKDINNKSYRVEIVSSFDISETREIQLAEEPFTTSWSGNDENIYEPLRASESTLRIVTSTPLLDLYSAEAMGTPVILYDNDTGHILWKGFVEPQLFDQEWESESDILELNCLDYIATLQYIKFEDVLDDKDVSTFESILNDIFSINSSHATNFLHHIYLPDTFDMEGYIKDESEFLPFSVARHNFYDEDGESMKCDEVLSEICKYLNLSAVQFHSDVYLLDFDAIKNDNYYCFERMPLSGGGWDVPSSKLKDIKIIDQSSYMDSGSTISLSPVYNKITVKDDLYPIDNYIPNIWDDLTNYGGPGFVNVVRTPSIRGYGTKHKSYFQFFKSPVYQVYSYKMNGDIKDVTTLSVDWDNPTTPQSVDYDTLRYNVGSVICKHLCNPYKEVEYEEPSSLNMDKFLLFYLHDFQPKGEYPIFKLVPSISKIHAIVGTKTYLVFSGSAIYMDDVDAVKYDNPVKPITSTSEMILDKEHTRESEYKPDNSYLTIQLKLGNKYYNGTNWTEDRSTFKLWFDRDKHGKENFIGKDYPIKSNIKWTDNINQDGFKVALPAGDITVNPEVTIYFPTERIQPKYRSEAIWLKNFDVKLIVANIENTDLVLEDEKSDTEYTNVINSNYVKEMDEITFKVCTYDNKTPNYSSVSIGDKLVDKIIDKTTNKSMRMEEHLIDKLVKQYSTPNTILDLNLKNDFKPYSIFKTSHFPNKSFIVDSASINWEMNTASLHLIEKK